MNNEENIVFEEIISEINYINLHLKFLNGVFIRQPGENKQEILDKASPIFFDLAFHLFYDHILLRIKKLTDPPKQMGSENLSIFNLLEKLHPFPTEIEADLESHKCNLISISSNIKKHRHKRISHNDLLVRLGSRQLSPVSEKEISEAIKILECIANLIASHYKNSVIDFSENTLPMNCEPHHLIEILKKGVAF